MSTIPPIAIDVTVAELWSIAIAHGVPAVYVLDEYMRQHPHPAPAVPRGARVLAS